MSPLPDYFTKAAIAEAEGRARSRANRNREELEQRIAELEQRVDSLFTILDNAGIYPK